MDCDFDNAALTCQRCGFVARSRDTRRNCSQFVPAVPEIPLYRRLANFSLAAIQHVASGLPTCSQAEIDARYAVCRGCDLYRPNANNPDIGRCMHEACGCTISSEAGYVRKLAWRDQACPLDKWPKLHSITV